MTSVIVPPVDLAPGMPSRVVTISATDVTEGGKSLEGQMVRFALSDSLDVTSGGDVIAKTEATVVLDAKGNGSIRLPVYSGAVKTWCGGSDWVILVTATWGSQKAVRVPAGTSSIALSALPNVRPLRGREKQWAITGASVTVTEGAQWGATVGLSGGVLDFDFTVPPAGTAFWKGTLDPSANLNTVTTPGMYGVWSGSPNAPGSGYLVVSEIRTTANTVAQLSQTFYVTGSSPETLYRFQGSTGWSAWDWIAGHDGMRFRQLPADADLNDVTEPGMYAYWTSAANAPATSGILLVTETRTDAGVWAQTQQIAFTSGSTPRIDMRFKAAFWSGWTRLDMGGFEMPPLPSQQAPTSIKTVPLALTTGGGVSTYPMLTGGVRMPVRYAVDLRRWRLHLRNINPRVGTPGNSVLQVHNVYVGKHAGDGKISGAWKNIGSSFQTGAGEIVTGWQVEPLEAGVEYLIAYSWTSSSATQQVVGGGWTVESPSGVASNAAPATRKVSLPLDAWIEAEAASDVPVVAGFGDSLTSGVGSTLPVHDSWLSQWCRTNRALPLHFSASGDTMAGWSDPGHYKWTRWDGFTRPDAVVHAMGSNDVFGGATLATMQDRFRATRKIIADKLSPVIFAATIMPREGASWDPMESVRRSYNTWLQGQNSDVRQVFGFTAAMSTDDETIIDSVDSDGIHLTTEGYARLARTITDPITSDARGTSKIAPISLSRPLGIRTEVVSSRSIRVPFTASVHARRWRVVVRNVNYRSNITYPGQTTIRFLGYGKPVYDAAGNVTSAFTEEPTTIVREQSAGDLANEWASPWIDKPLTPGEDHLLSMGYLTNGTEVTLSMGGGWWTDYNPGNADLVSDPTAYATERLPFDIRIETEVDAVAPVDLLVGDSISAGSNAGIPVRESPLAIAARQSGRNTRQHGFGGAAFGEWGNGAWANLSSLKWQDVVRYGHADRAFIMLGNNDIHAGDSLATLKANFQTLAGLLRERVSSNVIACTVTPRTAWTGTAKETVREQFNDWLRAYPAGITAVADTARAVEDSTGHAPRADYVTADGIHFNTAGSTALANAVLDTSVQTQAGEAGAALTAYITELGS